MRNEKQILENNVKEISKIIFGDSELHISVFSKEESIEYSESQFDFLCEIELLEKKIEQEQIGKLSKFLNKEVQQTSRKIFWFVGANGRTIKSIKKLKSKELQKDITLPKFIDDYIFNKLNASFAPNFKKFNKNLNHKKGDVLIYIGTYFPRSFAETYSIFNNIIQNEIIEKSYQEQEEINILDIGSGTGGNLSGLLLSLIENISKKANFNIVAVDGNKEALKFLEKIVFHIQLKYNLNISLNCHYVAFETITDLYENSKQFFEPNFDFIISSKMINEIITKDRDSYFNFYNHFAKYLNNEGLLLMLDVTKKIEVDYMPILLNKQTNRFIQENKGTYKTLIPTSCAKFDSICKQDCFSNNHFVVTHSKKKNDRTKVTYRIIGKSKFVNLILSKIDNIGNVIGWDNIGNQKYCYFISSTSNTQSAYKI
ncbi:MAG: hypothetical protein IMY72_08490 [Bacteroidetes bacterium]|nr:hypothetical protein [Bacteroidota bacterium]